MFALAVYANKFLIGMEGHMISSKKKAAIIPQFYDFLCPNKNADLGEGPHLPTQSVS